MNNADVIAAAVDYWRTQADGRARQIATLVAERDAARRDADRLRALIADIKADRDQWQHKAVNAWHDHTPSSLT